MGNGVRSAAEKAAKSSNRSMGRISRTAFESWTTKGILCPSTIDNGSAHSAPLCRSLALESKRKMSRDRFAELMEEAVIAFPLDLKSVLRIVEDPEVDEASRTRLAGSLIHVLSRGTAVPGVRGTLQHVGSVLLIRLALESARKDSPEAFESHVEAEPELLGALDEQLEVARAFLGEGMSVLEDAASKLDKLNFEGHSAEECVRDTDSSNWLYDAVHGALVDTIEIDEDDVHREIKDVQRIAKSLQARARK